MAWKIDPAHSALTFRVRHMMISWVRGEFTDYEGTVDFDTENPENSSVEVTIDASSIDTREAQRDTHLKSADFLNVEKYPQIRFKSTRVEATDEDSGKIYGDLTIGDVTNEIVLDVEYNGIAKSPWGTTSAGFTADTTFNRKDWGLNWNQALETGGVLVGDEIRAHVELEIVKQEEGETEEAETTA